MATLYSVSTHALRSGKVSLLDPGQFEAQQLVAETLLELNPPVITDSAAVARIAVAVVLQMNFQVAQGIDPLYKSSQSSSHSKESAVYRDRFVNPQAAAIVEEVLRGLGVLTDRYSVLTSHRTEDAR